MRPGPSAGSEHPLASALALLCADVPETTRDPQAWPRWAALLPHLLTATAHLDDGAALPALAMLADTSALLDQAGVYLHVHGRSAAARPLLERALAIAETADEPDQVAVGSYLSNLAVILRDLWDAVGARPLQERALAIGEAAYGPGHPTVAIYLNNLALTLKDLGDAVAARSLQERALAIDEAAYGPGHPAVATNLSNLAGILRDLGEAEVAQRLEERARAITEAVREREGGHAG